VIFKEENAKVQKEKDQEEPELTEMQVGTRVNQDASREAHEIHSTTSSTDNGVRAPSSVDHSTRSVRQKGGSFQECSRNN
jgi:hypothetical protein